MEKQIKNKKVSFNLTLKSIEKLDLVSQLVELPKTKIIEILLNKLEIDNIENEFDFYDIKVKNMKKK